ncbi:nucleoside hydrolase [Nocardia panacis]|uniref:Nucleoside hydrolase n=1 Tax=Nocardia panacis TaxID=2340916 RepID=A0A3A4KMI3_9NOCA|nr:nucleoside hydrolase [Nocardia panacis]RJO74194.1 nucleoside hydrolase [Nocardia panacis]
MNSVIVDPAVSVIMDTDIGYDPDDAFALVAAARSVEQLIVVTADEVRGGYRARYARALLDALDRPDVPVHVGIDLGSESFVVHDEALTAPAQPGAFHDAVESACRSTYGPVQWAGQGPLSNVVSVLTERPHLTEKIAVTQQGGWLDTYHSGPTKTSHNLRVDVRAAGVGLRMLHRPRLVLSDHTGVPEIRVTTDSDLYKELAGNDAPWARLLFANVRNWLSKRPHFYLHDPLTLSAALGQKFVRFAAEDIAVSGDAFLRREPGARRMLVSTGVDYDAFNAWQRTVIGL